MYYVYDYYIGIELKFKTDINWNNTQQTIGTDESGYTEL